MDFVAGHTRFARVVLLHIDLRKIGAAPDHHAVAPGAQVATLRLLRQEGFEILNMFLSRAVAALARDTGLHMERAFDDIGMAFGARLFPRMHQLHRFCDLRCFDAMEPLGAKSLRDYLASKCDKGRDEDNEHQTQPNNLWPHVISSTPGRLLGEENKGYDTHHGSQCIRPRPRRPAPVRPPFPIDRTLPLLSWEFASAGGTGRT